MKFSHFLCVLSVLLASCTNPTNDANESVMKSFIEKNETNGEVKLSSGAYLSCVRNGEVLYIKATNNCSYNAAGELTASEITFAPALGNFSKKNWKTSVPANLSITENNLIVAQNNLSQNLEDVFWLINPENGELLCSYTYKNTKLSKANSAERRYLGFNSRSNPYEKFDDNQLGTLYYADNNHLISSAKLYINSAYFNDDVISTPDLSFVAEKFMMNSDDYLILDSDQAIDSMLVKLNIYVNEELGQQNITIPLTKDALDFSDAEFDKNIFSLKQLQ